MKGRYIFVSFWSRIRIINKIISGDRRLTPYYERAGGAGAWYIQDII